jgi:spermidine/putrescine transport system permease protein
MKLRTWFLLPAWLSMAVLFAAPFAIVLAYSFLTRGVYGGIELPWTAESYQRLFDPLYLVILWRSFAMALAATALVPPAGVSRRALHFPRRPPQESLPATRHAALLDQFPGAHLRLDFPAARHRPVQHRVAGARHHPRPLPLLYNDGAVLLGLVYGYLPFMVLPIYATLERLDPALVEAAADLGARPLPPCCASSCRSPAPASSPDRCSSSSRAWAPT